MGICTRDFVQCFSVDIDVMTNFIRDWLEITGALPNSSGNDIAYYLRNCAIFLQICLTLVEVSRRASPSKSLLSA